MKRKEKDLTGTQYMYTSYKQIMWPKQRLVQWYAVGEKIDLTINTFTKQKKTFHQPKEISAKEKKTQQFEQGEREKDS